MKRLYAFLVLSIGITSCADHKTLNLDKKALIIGSGSKRWRVLSIKQDGTEQPLKDCEKDNYFVFKADNTVDYYSGAVKCDPNEPESSNLPWSISNDGTQFSLFGQTFTVSELTSSSLRLSGKTQTEEFVKDPNGRYYKYVSADDPDDYGYIEYNADDVRDPDNSYSLVTKEVTSELALVSP